MSSIQKSYIYKSYRNGTYLGNLPSVTSDFNYTLGINTAGTTISVTCAVSADISANAPPYLTTEAGDYITTEAGDYITTESPAQIIATGETPGNFLFRNGNHIKVYEVSQNNANGKIVFQGTIERMEATFGGDSNNVSTRDEILLTVYSDGQDLNNYVVPGSSSNFLDQSNTTYVAGEGAAIYYGVNYDSHGIPYNRSGAQTFITGAAVTNISAVVVRLGGLGVAYDETFSLTLGIYNTLADISNGITPLVSASISIPNGYSTPFEDFCTFTFPTPLSVTPLTGYCWGVSVTSLNDNSYAYIVDSGGNYYANGIGYVFDRRLGNAEATAGGVATDFYFKTYYSNYTVNATFTAQDPAAIVKSIMNTYISGGGAIGYTSGTVDLTGINVTYVFSLSTIYNAIQVCQSLAPFGFYFYVDVGTNTLYFKRTSSTPDLILVKGTHIGALSLVMSTENLVNLEYFSGGPTTTSGPNLFKQYSDQTSIQNYGIRLGLQSDNRVTLSTTSDTLGAAFIAENKDEQQQTQVTILDSSMDTSIFRPGLTVGPSGYGSLIDQLVLQIVEVIRGPEQVTLKLGRIPPRMHNTLQSAANAIAALQTQNNPSAPS